MLKKTRLLSDDRNENLSPNELETPRNIYNKIEEGNREKSSVSNMSPSHRPMTQIEEHSLKKYEVRSPSESLLEREGLQNNA